MKIIPNLRRHHYVTRVGTFLIAVALIAGIVGCAVVEYDLTISSTEGGSVTVPGEGTSTYYEGEVVNLEAIPDAGYRFVNWTGDVGTIADVEDATTTITINGDYSITAEFAVKQYSLVVTSTEGGSITTHGENRFTYDEGEVVNLVAQAEGGYHFVSWTGDVGTIADPADATTTITMNGGYIITADFAIDLYFETDAWVDLSGEGTLPAGERNPMVFFQIFTNIVMDSVRVDLPDGGSVIVPAFTEEVIPDVDQVTVLRFLTYVEGMAIAGGEYVFTGLDMAGEPVPEARNTDVWVGVEPPEPPTDVRAEVIEGGILVTWNESAIVPGSFEPAAVPQLGCYWLEAFRIETAETVYGVYLSPGMSARSHLIPRDKADFVEGGCGLSLGEMEDGTYNIGCWVQSVAPQGSLGRGAEYGCTDPGQVIFFTIQDGEIAIE